MNNRRSVFAVLIAVGFLLAVITILISAAAIHAAPSMVQQPEEALTRAKSVMDAICASDYDAASKQMLGSPNPGNIPKDSSPAVELLWNAYRKSMEYHFVSDIYATDSGAAIDVSVRRLDLNQVIGKLEGHAQVLLDAKTASGSQASMFDSSNQLRQDAADKLLSDAVLLALGEEKPMYDETFSLSLVFDAGQWWVVPEGMILNVLSGSFVR